MYKQRIFAMLGVICLILSSCTWGEVRVKMQFSPKAGDVYHFDMTMEQDIKQTLNGEEANSTQTMRFGFSMTAAESDEDGNVWVDVRYDWVQMKQSSPTGELEYDSRNPIGEVDPNAMGLGALIGKGYSMKISPAGEILSVKGLDTMITEMLNDIGIEDGAVKAQLEELFKKQYNEESMKEQAGNMIVKYPEGDVKIGDTWTASSTASTLAPLTVDTTYTLLAYEDGIATIGATSTISSDQENPETDMGLYKIRYNISGTQDGTIKVNTKVGWSASSTITQTLSGDMTLIAGEEETVVPVSIESVVTLEMTQE